MENIKRLVNEGYILFNVNDKKQPVNSNGFLLSKWEGLTYNELLKHHNYNSNLWCMRMGLQHNNKNILSLDFDLCGGKDKNGYRVGCEYTTKNIMIILIILIEKMVCILLLPKVIIMF
jgi:hypothetical protein